MAKTKRSAKPKPRKAAAKPARRKPAARPPARKPAAKPRPKSRKLTAADVKLVVSDTARRGWLAAAEALPDDAVGFSGPLAVLLGEGVDVARFARARWEPVRKAKKVIVTPGLASSVRRDLKVVPYAAAPVLSAHTAQEILELVTLTQEASTRHTLSAGAPADGPHPRIAGSSLLSDLRGVIESFLDDGVEDEGDARLDSVQKAHADDPATDDALAGALADYAALATSLCPALDGYADFDPDWIDRAQEFAAALRVAPGRPNAPDGDTLDTRNRLATLLVRRVRLVRAKARYAFRRHPDVLREVTSAYERRRRSERKDAAPAPSPAKT